MAAARLRGERAPVHHVRRDPARTCSRRSWSSSRCASPMRSSRSLTLTFLGFGVQPPSPDWGLDIATNYGVVSGGLLVGGAVRRARDRFAGRRSHPGRRSRSRECWSDEHGDRTDGQPRSSAGAGGRARGRQRRRHLSRARTPARSSCATSRSGSLVASPTGWWASPAAGSRRSRWPSSATWRATARVSGGSISIDGRDVLAMRGGELRKLRANTVSMVYQEPGQCAEPDDPGRAPGRRGVRDRRASARRRRSTALARCSRRCGSRTRPG